MKNFGFGFMRLPMISGTVGVSGEVDIAQTMRMVDLFLSRGFTYFDTAHGYIEGESERTLRKCLVDRYPRESYVLANKLTEHFFQSEADIRRVFEEQLRVTGAGYFDYYLMHSLCETFYPKYTRCRAFEVAKEWKAAGKIRHIGISFHDRAEVLERILLEHPEIEVVQIQLNYVDYDDLAIQSGLLQQVCQKYHQRIIVMEPCKGGNLIDLPPAAQQLLDELAITPANLAIRYAASCENVWMVLSGMSTEAQMRENLDFMQEFQPLSPQEQQAAQEVGAIFKQQGRIACTSCAYCVKGCPQHILIPALFSCYNKRQQFKGWASDYYYQTSIKDRGRASDCISCGKCEKVCPQHLPIRQYLKDVAAELEH